MFRGQCLSGACACGVSAAEVSGQALLPCLVFEAYGFGGSGIGDRVSCRLALVGVLTIW